ncbi:hypothetical protein [Pedobacter rhizosphaerae]|uniref:Uncharacterized protein n=1 Tax=Pedobacter rhizosphaerae TaxID=390241 RepID=A0A1H9TI19_9SPHI|nr:hypothetical protein [Pedobacter rhizosphaerae]SER96832.1 hypothetical protein SAMN04488023_1237 [Pedobacter rhizosphaerae]
MKSKEKNTNGLSAQNGTSEQEKINQLALGNLTVSKELEDINLSLPKLSGTGGNNAAATPDSLIVHEDKSNEERYQSGEKEAEG